ncbi:DUF5304 family protein [Streptomyces tropicalis]|uniref:DUF5304 family protein n=1 Tax=Streptomyces tropicalis TaxID=3034234 RepID=A0ABT5ZY59_9ACTN|nr:DUF5304 family protein [Streptomyces tropicalis]MDF3297142.1 DUF5304 family protein [Streptomyces tropicalis]
MSEDPPTPDAAPQDAAGGGARAAADADAWATACAEDLAAEKARRRERHGPPSGSAAEELRRFVGTVADRLSGWESPLLGAVAGPAAQQVVRQVVEQARAAVEPVVERNPDVFDHLAAAGGELLAAYRSAVQAQERRWTGRSDAPEDGPGAAPGGPGGPGGPDRGPDGPGERIDLD